LDYPALLVGLFFAVGQLIIWGDLPKSWMSHTAKHAGKREVSQSAKMEGCCHLEIFSLT